MNTNENGQDTLIIALERASDELAYLSDCVGRLQHTIPDSITQVSPDLFRELQTLDYVHQHLDELRTYVDAVKSLSDENWLIDINCATTTLRLGLMVKRLRGIAVASRAPHEEAGELELLCSKAG